LATKLQIKFIRSLELKKNRHFSKMFVCEGLKMVEEAVRQSKMKILNIYGTPHILSTSIRHHHLFEEVSEKDMEMMTHLKSPSDVLALLEMPHESYSKEFNLGPYTLYLDHIKDPGNMGTILRNADWFGIQHVFISQDCVDVFNSKTVQSTMGAIFRVSVTVMDLPSLIKSCSFQKIYGAMLHGTPIQSVDFVQNSLIVIGSESFGITDEAIPYVTDSVTIPRYGGAESLNAAVATGIFLSHLRT
jgi:TrmH family RNA methyltransferase